MSAINTIQNGVNGLNKGREEELSKIAEEMNVKRNAMLNKCCVDLIKEEFDVDTTGWDVDRIRKFLDCKGFKLILEPNLIGSFHVGLMRKSDKKIPRAYEIFLDFDLLPTGEAKITIKAAPMAHEDIVEFAKGK